MLRYNRTSFLLTVILGVLAFCPAVALAAAPQAYTVPWVATNPTTPHDAWLNKTITFKGASDSQGANIQYSWDFGDGAVTAFAPVADRYSIEGVHAY
ncbi:MAG: PKD domain-containing protein, partial [Candidatus Solibacter sp.]|nr:PKD domain-containing protein [Candidatus Solibacter sp.]